MVKFRASVQNRLGEHQVHLQAGHKSHSLIIPPKDEGYGSSVTGGELLFLALATCYCNDLYREAAKQGIAVEAVEVDVEGDFERDGAPMQNITYRVRVKTSAPPEQVQALMRHTDALAEIQNTLRGGTQVQLESCECM